MTGKPDLYQQVTDRILAALEAGTRPWQCDWSRNGPALRITGERYRGINQLLLSMSGAGYASPTWMTFKQALELGGGVRKGERSTPIVFFKTLERDQVDEQTGEEKRVGIPMLRGYNVFNVDQIDGLPERFAPIAPTLIEGKDRDELAEAAIRACGADIGEDGGDQAYYNRLTDSIHLPAFERFFTTGGYLATMAHEVIHWTGAEKRLDRTKGGRFGDSAYALEELVAEIGAAFVCGALGIAGEHFDNHAAYIGNWIRALKNDKRAIFRAAAAAQSAADLVLEAKPAELVDQAPIASSPAIAAMAPAPVRQLELI